jgi:hypothetical protein
MLSPYAQAVSLSTHNISMAREAYRGPGSVVGELGADNGTMLIIYCLHFKATRIKPDCQTF